MIDDVTIETRVNTNKWKIRKMFLKRKAKIIFN